MKFEELKSLFPVTVQLTQEMIEKGKESNNMSVNSCNGAQVLRSVLPSPYNEYATWAVTDGTIRKFPTSHYSWEEVIPEEDIIRIESKNSKGNWIDMMDLTEPTEVILQLY